jgi:hypothetical protein
MTVGVIPCLRNSIARSLIWIAAEERKGEYASATRAMDLINGYFDQTVRFM